MILKEEVPEGWLEPRGEREVVRNSLIAKAMQKHMPLDERDPERRYCVTHGAPFIFLGTFGECPVCLRDVYAQVREIREEQERLLELALEDAHRGRVRRRGINRRRLGR